MSSPDPAWFCHECQTEMQPLMVPDPICSSCHGSFVEKLDNVATDDPRQFQASGPRLDGEGAPLPFDMDSILMSLLFNRPRLSEPRTPSSGSRSNGRGSGISFTVQSGEGGPRTYSFGSSPSRAEPPLMSEFLRDSSGPRESGSITGTMMAQYLMSLIGGRGSLGEMFGADGSGRMGDYVYNQQALDEIITQLMENNNTGRPVPATDDIIDNLPREVLEAGSPTLEKDCAVCKEQFKLETENSDELVVLTLPCKHPFHEHCILPWLKSSGTCPVCRHALVPQPEYHGPPGTSSQPSSPNASRSRTGSPIRPSDSGGILSSLFGFPPSRSTGPSTSGGSQGSQPSPTSTSNPRPEPSRRGSGPPRDSHPHVPGSWDEDLD